MLVRIEYADREPQFSPDDSNGLDKIGIICDEYGNLELALEAIAQLMRSDVYVGSLFFGLIPPKPFAVGYCLSEPSGMNESGNDHGRSLNFEWFSKPGDRFAA
jgi:hypothetical protein